MCTDLRLVRLPDMHVSARTLDFQFDTRARLQVVPRGQQWQATPTELPAVPALTWTNALGFVAMDCFGFPDYFSDGLNEAGLSVGTLWLPETDLPASPPAPDAAGAAGAPVIDFANVASWLLGTCRTVADARAALSSVTIWSPTFGELAASHGLDPHAPALASLAQQQPTEHLSIHDASGGDLVVEFLPGGAVFHDNPIGVLTNSPTYDWHLTNLRNYVGLTNVEARPVNLMGMPVTPTGNGSGLLGMPGDVTPPSRFVRATMLTQVVDRAADHRDAVNQAFHCLDIVSVPRFVAASGDYTQWSVARDHDNLIYYVRSYDSWTTDAHDLRQLGVIEPGPRSVLARPA